MRTTFPDRLSKLDAVLIPRAEVGTDRVAEEGGPGVAVVDELVEPLPVALEVGGRIELRVGQDLAAIPDGGD